MKLAIKIVKSIFLAVIAVFASIMCLGGLFGFVVLLKEGEFQQGKAIALISYLFIIGLFGVLAIICCRKLYFMWRNDERTSEVHRQIINKAEVAQEYFKNENSIEKTNSKESVVIKAQHGGELGCHSEETKRIKSAQTTKFDKALSVSTESKNPKCNCDGCFRQKECEYGHVIYDEVDKSRMTLFDKFMMLHLVDGMEPIEFNGNIATVEEVHNKKLLFQLDKDTLLNTLNYLQEQKKRYLAVGKCGKAYFSFMKMEDEIVLVKETIKEYDSYYKKLDRIESIKPFILKKIDLNEEVLQKDLFAEYDDIGKGQVSKVINQLVADGIVKKEKHGNTYVIKRR